MTLKFFNQKGRESVYQPNLLAGVGERSSNAPVLNVNENENVFANQSQNVEFLRFCLLEHSKSVEPDFFIMTESVI